MYKKILLIMACATCHLNYSYCKNISDCFHEMLELRKDFARRLENDINNISNPPSSQQQHARQTTVEQTMVLSELPGSVPEEAHQIVYALKNSIAYCNPGYVFYGKPGIEANALVRAIAKESKAYIVSQPASEVMGAYTGEGAAVIRELFATAKDLSRNAPVIIFIDEIHIIGNRGTNNNVEQTCTFNQLLSSMDTVQGVHPIVVLAATNHEDQLDKALRRTGRFHLVEIEPN